MASKESSWQFPTTLTEGERFFVNFDFGGFYQHLSNRGYLIYPGKVSNADCFRIGSIGYIFESDIHALLSAIQDTLIEMQVDLSGI